MCTQRGVPTALEACAMLVCDTHDCAMPPPWPSSMRGSPSQIEQLHVMMSHKSGAGLAQSFDRPVRSKWCTLGKDYSTGEVSHECKFAMGSDAV